MRFTLLSNLQGGANMARKLLTTKDIAERCGCEVQTVSRWAAENDIDYVGENRRKIYVFTESDYERFLARAKPGKRAKQKDK